MPKTGANKGVPRGGSCAVNGRVPSNKSAAGLYLCAFPPLGSLPYLDQGANAPSMQARDVDFAPYAPARNVLSVLRRCHEKGLPDTLTTDELQRMGIARGNVPRTLQALRFLSLVDEKSRQTPALQSIGSATSGDYAQTVAKVVRNAYEPIFSRIDPARATDLDISDAFRKYQPQGQRPRMVSLFLAFMPRGPASPPTSRPQRGPDNPPTLPR